MTRKRSKAALLPLLLPALLPALLLAGCAAPEARLAVAPVDPGALGLGGGGGGAGGTIASDWWTAFDDPQLNRIMADALAHSPTLESALARLRLAESGVAAIAASRQPQLAVNGSEMVQRLSEVYMIPPPYGGSVRAVGELTANLGYDLDFWGRQADRVHQARARAGAAALDVAAARLALAGAVAQAYVELARAERSIANAEAMIETRDRSIRLLQIRSDNRLDSDVDLRAAEILATEARQTLLRARTDREAATHALALLAGAGADYPAGIGPTHLSMDRLAPPAEALPADLLARRPDILGARMAIEAAAAGREVARKAFYPNINLAALTGLQAMGLDKLLTGGAFTAGAGAAIHLPIFDGGQLRAGYAGATASLDSAVAGYNEAVLTAIREAADASTRAAALADDLGMQREATAGLAELRRLGEVRFDSGLGSRLDLIDADMRLLAARQRTIDLEAGRASARIRLLVALGGGFETDPRGATAEENAPEETESARQRNSPRGNRE